jgi:hypothetical protein
MYRKMEQSDGRDHEIEDTADEFDPGHGLQAEDRIYVEVNNSLGTRYMPNMKKASTSRVWA